MIDKILIVIFISSMACTFIALYKALYSLNDIEYEPKNLKEYLCTLLYKATVTVTLLVTGVLILLYLATS